MYRDERLSVRVGWHRSRWWRPGLMPSVQWQQWCVTITLSCVSPMNLSVFVKVLQPLQYFLQDGGDACLIQHSGLVLAARDDMLDDVQHWAWERAIGLSQDMLTVHSGQVIKGTLSGMHLVKVCTVNKTCRVVSCSITKQKPACQKSAERSYTRPPKPLEGHMNGHDDAYRYLAIIIY